MVQQIKEISWQTKARSEEIRQFIEDFRLFTIAGGR
jgi:hypothetical protein